jgi:hypothetical protein
MLMQRYKLPRTQASVEVRPSDPDVLALASLCLVLLNSNEFIYVD